MSENNVQIHESATLDVIRPCAHTVCGSVKTEGGWTITVRYGGIVHQRGVFCDWHTVEYRWITGGDGVDVTITSRRPINKES